VERCTRSSNFRPPFTKLRQKNQTNPESGFIELYIDKATSNAAVKLNPPPVVTFDVRRVGSGSAYRGPVTITGRRQDLYDSGTEQKIEMPKATLLAGHWEFSGQASPDTYVESIRNNYQVRREQQPDKSVEWFDVFLDARSQGYVQVAVADKAAQITGSVMKEGKAVPGGPVFSVAHIGSRTPLIKGLPNGDRGYGREIPLRRTAARRLPNAGYLRFHGNRRRKISTKD